MNYKIKYLEKIYPVHYGPDLKKVLMVTNKDVINKQLNGLCCCSLLGEYKVYGVKIPKEDLVEILK